MDQQEAEEIANNWKYDGIYSFYDMTSDEEDYVEFIDETRRDNGWLSCYSDNELTGFYIVKILEGNVADLGLGLKPNYTGKGIGLDFLNAVMAHITSNHGIKDFELIVAKFNLRAIKVYKRAGFMEVNEFVQSTNGGHYDFIKMKKEG